MSRRANPTALRQRERSSAFRQCPGSDVKVEEMQIAVRLHRIDDAAIAIECESRRLRSHLHGTAGVDKFVRTEIQPRNVNRGSRRVGKEKILSGPVQLNI